MSNNFRNKFILIGLGNCNRKYASTRHNAGRMLAAYLRQHPVEGLEAFKTDCFMNQSGEWIKNKMAGTAGWPNGQTVKFSSRSTVQPFNRFDRLFIAHDDLDLKLGGWKIRFGKGPRLHKGILSIEKALGTKDFWRVRIGIDNRKSQLSSAKISQHQIADKSAESDSGLSDLIHNPILADASRSKPAFSVSGEEYVLRPFKREEKIILKQTFRSIKSALLEYCTKNARSSVFSDRMI